MMLWTFATTGMATILVWASCTMAAVAEPNSTFAITCPKDASTAETLAAREIRRYLYLRTESMLPIVSDDAMPKAGGIVIARKDRPVLAAAGLDKTLQSAIAALGDEDYLLQTVDLPAGRYVLAVGGGDKGVLYAAYRLAEHFGVRFYLHGDLIPDQRIALKLPDLSDRGKPLFSVRGIQPFHDFPEGPDWWNLDDYKQVLSQLPKLGMNFVGLHTYPEGGVGPEPAVWIGRSEDMDGAGKVKASYPASWFSTLSGTWNYPATKTGDYAFGCSQLFEQDAFGSEVMKGHWPRSTTAEGQNEVFERSARLLGNAFTYARRMGIQTCLGTETPLIIPKAVRERMGITAHATPQQVLALYEGMFLRLMRTMPLDYYWLWTPEGWTWHGAKDEQVAATSEDLALAVQAAKNVKAPFTLATCGWVLGPPKDRTAFDTLLPKTMPFSCINRQVGKTPVEQGFAALTGRPKWAIPWMEDDPGLTSPQLWVGRMRKDANDALKYGCTGLLGIHWRTRILAPNVSALARAAWDQAGWTTLDRQDPNHISRLVEGAEGGTATSFQKTQFAGTAEPELYQTVRWGMAAYHLALPGGKYKVTLKFCEPRYDKKDTRVFGVKLQDKTVVNELDIFDKVGKDKALELSFDDIDVTNGWLNIEFVPLKEYPCISAIVAEGPAGTKKINCGGPAFKDYLADLTASPVRPGRGRYLPTGDFYADWALANFGPQAADKIAQIFEQIDGRLPEPATWVHGPGNLHPDAKALEKLQDRYAFVAELEALRPMVTGAGNLERYDYWLNNFRYMKSVEQVKACYAQSTQAMKELAAEKDANAVPAHAEKVLSIRRELIAAAAETHKFLLATVSNTGELGTICNWQQQVVEGLFRHPGRELAKVLKKDLPADAQPSQAYTGPLRLIVPTVRTSVEQGQELGLRLIVLSQAPPEELAVFCRPMGTGPFSRIDAKHVSRGVYAAQLPAAGMDGLEYYVQARGADGATATFPVTAPGLCQTVIAIPPDGKSQ